MLELLDNRFDKPLDVIIAEECEKNSDMCTIVYYKKKYGKGSSKTRLLTEGIVLQKAAVSDVKLRGHGDMDER